MAISAKLELRQSQQLVMTPQLQQAIRLLQLSNIELNEYVDGELERNPLLEREDQIDAAPGDEAQGAPDAGTGPSTDNSAAATGQDEDWLDLDKPNTDAAAVLDTAFENVFPDTSSAELATYQPAGLGADGWSGLRQRNSGSDGASSFESYVAGEPTLKDHLLEQLNLMVDGPAEKLVARHLVDMIDDTGYLRADLGEMAQKLGAPMPLVDGLLAKLQSCEPAGIGARDLAECMALQLKEMNRFDPQIALFLEHLDLLGACDLSGLRRAVGVDAEELADMICEIKQLNPKPGLQFGSVEVQAVVPDVFVRAAADGSWHVELNTDTLPRVLVNRSYYTMVSKHTRGDNDKEYLTECLQTANWLTKSLDQRARTILRVSEEIVRQQDGFLTHGVQHLRPLNLKTVADAISMHESTVSRVTSNKYMATSRGIFELKYFFTSAIASARDGEAHSSESVRHRIKQLIDAETVQCVLSDDKLVERLRTDGIDIARRTVAKYREALRIPSSVQRRRQKRMVAQSQPRC